MPVISCQIHAHSNCEHIQQLYAGFSILARLGIISLKQKIVPYASGEKVRKRLIDSGQAKLLVIVNERFRIFYDTRDNCNIDTVALAECDLYFKRSYCNTDLDQSDQQLNKVRPLGLNYAVYPNGFDGYGLRRSFRLGDSRERILAFFRTTRLAQSKYFFPRANLMHDLPKYDAPPKVLFLARTWSTDKSEGLSEHQREERYELNETRAQTIRYLREQFGKDFLGGFSLSDLSAKKYADLLVPEQLTRKSEYLRILREHPICVATTGLHGSTGWKFSEYVAFSKSIVSEKLNYLAPGSFSAGNNYLEFNSPEECVKHCLKLFSDRAERGRLMTNNYNYYHSNVRPDVLVLNSVLTALSELT